MDNKELNDKLIKCVICGKQYKEAALCCPYCKYPALSFSSNIAKKTKSIAAYRKVAGFDKFSEPERRRIEINSKENTTNSGKSNNNSTNNKVKGKKKPWIIAALIVLFIIGAVHGVLDWLNDGSVQEKQPVNTTTDISTDQGNYTEYTNSGISFLLPAEWIDNTDINESMKSVGTQGWSWTTPENSKEKGMLVVENISKDSQKYDYETYFKEGMGALIEKKRGWMKEDPEYEIIDQGEVSIDGADCSFVEYTSILDLEEDNLTLEYLTYDLYIPVNNGAQIAVVEYSYQNREKNKGDSAYTECANAEADREIRDHVIDSIAVTGIDDSEVVPQYEEKVYSYEGISITLPSDWELDDSRSASHEWSWNYPEWSELYISIERIGKDDYDYEKGAEGLASTWYDYFSGEDNYTDYHKGTLSFGDKGVTGYYAEGTETSEQYDDRYNYYLFIPIESKSQITKIIIIYEANGIFSERDKKLQELIINSIQVE